MKGHVHRHRKNSRSIAAIIIAVAAVGCGGMSGDGATELIGTQKAALTSMITPAPLTTLGGSSQLFSWAAGSDEYALWIGSGPGRWDLWSKMLGTSTSVEVSRLPIDGSTLYVRLWDRVGTSWMYQDYTYTAWTAAKPGIVSPSSPSVLGGDSATFAWSAGADEYALWVGSSMGSWDIWAQSSLGTSTSAVVSGLPVNGSAVYVRFWYRYGSSWYHSDYGYTAFSAALPTITSPPQGSTVDTTAVFTWPSGADEYALWVGTKPGGYDVWSRSTLGAATSATVSGLPFDGAPLYVRLFYRYGSTWGHVDHQYASVLHPVPRLLSPAAGSTLTGASATFSWDGGADEYALWVGKSVGDYGTWARSSLGTATTATVTGLPVDGSTVYVRFFYRYGSTWGKSDTTYTAFK